MSTGNRLLLWMVAGAGCWLLSAGNSFADSLFESRGTEPLTSSFDTVVRGRSEFTVEAIRTKFDTPGGLIGHPDAPGTFNDFDVPTAGAMSGATVGTVTPSVVGQRQDDEPSYGLRVSWNYTTANDGRIEVSGFWLDDATQYFQRGLGTMTSGADETTVSVTAAGSYGDGAGGGYAVPFDQFFRIDLTTSASSLAADFGAVGYWWGPTLIQPTLGARYIEVDEVFSMAGADSGLDYTHDATGAPDPDSLTPPVVAVPPYSASLLSAAENEMYGPQLGLNFTTTGKRFRIGGHSRVGVMFGDAALALSGTTISPTFTENAPFATTGGTSYESMLLEQSLHLDVNLSQLARLDCCLCRGETILRLGWSVLYLSDVVRPTNTIVWTETPSLRQRAVDLKLHTLSAGLVIRF